MSWTLIEHQALSSSAASVTLGSGGTIPQTYKTLRLVISGRNTAAGSNAPGMRVALNGSTANFTSRIVYGNGTATGSYSDTNEIAWTSGDANTANTFASTDIVFTNYSSTSASKAISSETVIENNATRGDQAMHAVLWSNNNAITSITVSPSSDSWKSGSTFTLYGLA